LANADGKQGQRPARVIDLGLLIGHAIAPRLKETRDFNEMPAYATMSHCWGRNMSTTLTRKVYAQYHEHLPFESMPRKFVQAMQATKRLGLQYLWIDALCIVQDDDSECENEVAKMHHIYQHCEFNIAAASAASWSDPLWDNSDRRLTEVITICPGWTGIKLYCVDEDLWLNNIGLSPLLKRGWVLQETTLAPRNLYFGKNEMFWECSCLQACESWPSGLPKAENSNKMKLGLVTEIQVQLESVAIRNNHTPRRGAYGLPPIASPEYTKLAHPPASTFEKSTAVDPGFRLISYDSDANFRGKPWNTEEPEPKTIASTSSVVNSRSRRRGHDFGLSLRQSRPTKEPSTEFKPGVPDDIRRKVSFLHLWPEVVKRYTSAELSRPGKCGRNFGR